MARGTVFNIQKYSLADGPGIRTTVFLKGCPAACWWCHNPESQAGRPEAVVLTERCLACGECAAACPQGVAGREVGDVAGGERCLFCGDCVDACPSGARRLAGREMTVSEVMAAIVQDRIFYEESGGGATFSGGEPLSQFDFLRALLTACRKKGVRTAVDTGGFAPRQQLLTIAPLTDLFLYDIKVMDGARHRAATGIGNREALENLVALGEVHDAIWVRVPIIPGFNDDRSNMDATARFAATVKGVRQVNLLPYHRTWVGKARQFGREPSGTELAAPSPARLEELAAIFLSQGIMTRAGG